MQTIKDTLILREKVIREVREYFHSQGFIEVETPILVKNPDPEPSIEPFQTTWHPTMTSKFLGYLITSPEFFMKRLLSNGSGSIFQICKCFRDFEPASPQHNPEFTMIEWYRVDADYTDIMKDCEKLLVNVLKAVKGENSTALTYQSKQYELALPWERVSVAEAFEKYSGISPDVLFNNDAFLEAAREKGYQVEGFTYDDVFHQIILNEIEPYLGADKPTFLYDYPVSQAALAKKKVSDPRVAERFELYLGGLELANAFSELADPAEQQSRFEQQLLDRQKSNQNTWSIDQAFITDLKKGLPRTGGIALGIDRLIMLLADAETIADVLPFPTSDIFPTIDLQQ